MPPDNGFRSYDHQDLAPFWPKTAQQNPKYPILGSQPRARSFSLQYAQLLTEGKDLQAQDVTGTEEGIEQREQADEKPNHRPAFIAQASAASSGQLLEFKASRSIGDGQGSAVSRFALLCESEEFRGVCRAQPWVAVQARPVLGPGLGVARVTAEYTMQHPVLSWFAVHEEAVLVLPAPVPEPIVGSTSISISESLNHESLPRARKAVNNQSADCLPTGTPPDYDVLFACDTLLRSAYNVSVATDASKA